jgi:hypothetical protein
VPIAELRDRAIHWGIRFSAVLAILFCAAGAHAAGPAARMPFGSLVMAADLDGDQRPDIATAGVSRRDGAGYVLDITLRLSSVDADIITVRTAGIAGRITARDLDGDADRDLILESFDRVPLAIVLNDGGGHFHQGNLDEFRARLRPDPRSIEEPAGELDSPVTAESPASPADAPAPAASRPDAAAEYAAPLRHECFVVLRHSIWATRGPPATL